MNCGTVSEKCTRSLHGLLLCEVTLHLPRISSVNMRSLEWVGLVITCNINYRDFFYSHLLFHQLALLRKDCLGVKRLLWYSLFLATKSSSSRPKHQAVISWGSYCGKPEKSSPGLSVFPDHVVLLGPSTL